MYDQLMKVAKGFRLVHIGMLVIIIGAVGGLLGMCLGLGVLGAGAASVGPNDYRRRRRRRRD